MDFFRPKLASGENARLSFLYLGYKLNLLWPLENRASLLQYFIKYSLVMLILLSYVMTILGQSEYIYEHSNNIEAVSECLSTLLMGTQFFIRTSLMACRQKKMRQLLEQFYKDIYFISFKTATWHGQYYRNMRIITVSTAFYCTTTVVKLIMYPFEVVAIGGLSSKTKPYFYRMSFNWYDAQDPVNFIITSLYSCWLIVSCSIMMAADDYFLCTILIHTSCRYKELQMELKALMIASIREASNNERRGITVHIAFRQRLQDIFRRQQLLESFVEQAKEFFTYQIFFCLNFGVLCLCVVTFHLQMAPSDSERISYTTWLCSQTAEFILIGYFGQKLMNESCSLGDSYYKCQWEEILAHGNNQVNKFLLNDIKFAIMRAERGVAFDGIKMFPLNHQTVGYALRSALSYYMFLKTINEAN